jgi:hypothetical protein
LQEAAAVPVVFVGLAVLETVVQEVVLLVKAEAVTLDVGIVHEVAVELNRQAERH